VPAQATVKAFMASDAFSGLRSSAWRDAPADWSVAVWATARRDVGAIEPPAFWVAGEEEEENSAAAHPHQGTNIALASHFLSSVV